MIPESDMMVIFGYMKYYQDHRIGHILMVNMTNGEVTAFNNVLGGSGIDQAFALESGNLLVFGDITLYNQPNEQLQHIAYCSFSKQTCINLGNGLSDYLKIINSIETDNMYFVAYISLDASYIVQFWDKSFSGWNLILKTTKSLFYDSFSMEVYNGIIYISGTFQLSSQSYGCKGEVKEFASWNATGNCWNQEVSGSDDYGIWKQIKSSSGYLYGLGLFPGALAYFSNDTWTGMNPPDCNIDYYDLWLLSPSEGGILLNCQEKLLFFNQTTQNWVTLKNFVICSNTGEFSLFTQYVQVKNEIYSVCPGLWTETNNVTVSKYNMIEDNTTILTNIDRIHSNSLMYQLCSSELLNYVLAIGDFVQIDNQIFTGAALWNGTGWTNVHFDDQVDIMGSTDVTCFANSTVIYLVYRTLNQSVNVASLDILRYKGKWTMYHPFNNSKVGDVFGVGPERPLHYKDNLYFIYNSQNGINITSDILSLNVISGEWSTPFNSFLENSGASLLSIKNDGEILYLGGKFTVNVNQRCFNGEESYKIQWTGKRQRFYENLTKCPNSAPLITYTNIAKYDLKTKLWMFIEPVRIGSSTFGSVLSMAVGQIGKVTYLFAGGNFINAGQYSVNNVAVANASGYWSNIPAINAGLPNTIVQQLAFDTLDEILYIVGRTEECNPFSSCTYLSVYDSGILQTKISQCQVITYFTTEKDYFVGVLIGASMFTLFLLVSIILIKYFVKDNTRKYIQLAQVNSTNIDEEIQLIIDDPNINKIDRKDIVQQDIIGVGGQAVVKRGMYKKKPVAIKLLHNLNLQTEMHTFIQEIQIMSQIKHKHIVDFIGISCSKNKGDIWLVSELMDYDILKAYNSLTNYNKLKISKDIAKGMEYLHSFDPPVLHRDLKLSNILLKKDGSCKISDFGVSRLLPSEMNNTITKESGTLLYQAPEIWIKGICDEKSDVYSYGLLLIELFTGEKPFKDTNINYILEFMEKFKNREIELTIPDDEDIPKFFKNLMKICTSWEKEDRPDFKTIVLMIKKK